MAEIKLESEHEDDERAAILLVDDESLILQSMELVLERQYKVFKETDPLKVMKFLSSNRIDVVISDEMMPGLRGCELAERIHNEHPNICKIILSGNSDKKDIVKAINKGHIFSFLFKPVDVNQLLQAVRQGLVHKRMKETIENQNAILEEKNRDLLNEVLKKSGKIIEMEKFYELGKFSASIVHDLNSPLQTLVTGYQLLEEEIAGSPNSSPAAKNILTLIDNSLVIMENMLKSISNKIHNSAADKPVLFDLNEVVERNINFMKLKNQNGDAVAFSFIPGEDLPKMRGVPVHFDQILSNLLKNSIDAMESSKEKNIIIKTFVKSDKVCLFIKDTGTGIKPEHIDNIFDVGFSTKETGKGTGLGLVITKQMINSYKGKIKVESEYGAGASILICFPIK
jgi:two-component system, sensor histidine kinase and response regulator